MGVKLEGLADVRPAESSRRERQLLAAVVGGEEDLDKNMEEVDGEQYQGRGEDFHDSCLRAGKLWVC